MPRLAQRLGLLAVAALVVAGLDPAGVGGGEAAAEESPYTPLADFDPADLGEPRVDPSSFSAVDVDLGALRSELSDAPRTQGRGVQGAGLTFEVPKPGGGTETFSLQRTQVMEPALAADHPEIATYAGRGVDDPRLTVVLDVTPMGFHAAVRSPSAGRAWFVDPAVNERGTTEHLAYYGAAVEEPAQGLVEPEPIPEDFSPDTRQVAAAAGGGPVDQRVYRVALMNDPSYAKYFGTENVLAEKVTLMNRVNQVYNDDLAITMVLVEDSEKTNLDTRAKAIGADGPCGSSPCYQPPSDGVSGDLAGCGVDLLTKNRVVLGQLIGAENYDIGHVVLGKNGGGVAFLGVVGAELKGGGCTGLPFPEGDFFAIDYVAHEMGHQFDGPHTFNGTQGACAGGNRTARTSVEPGSGSSVMAYAGICDTDDLQQHTDPYFSQRTITNVTNYVGGDLDDSIEVQTVSLRGFDEPGDQVTLAYEGRRTTITRGATTYNRVAVDAAIEELTGRTVTIAPWDYAPLGEAPGRIDDRGFQVIFAATTATDDPTAERVDVPQLRIPSAGQGFVGTTTQGGPTTNGGEVNADVNTAPEVVAPADRTLPVRTPFALTASGRDADGDTVSFLWEQNDVGARAGTALIDNAKTNGPLFRVFGQAADVSLEDSLESPSPGQNIADGTPTRVFPDMRQVLAGNTNAATGACPTPASGVVTPRIRECFAEFLPTAAYLGAGNLEEPSRAMNFRVTARDGFAGGGGTAHDDVRLTLDRTAGPFQVTSQKAGSTLRSGDDRRVTWAVNGTDALAARVRISLSTDGGRTFPTVLAQSTANDGAARVDVPADATDEARIKIEAVRNYFFAVNSGDFTIDAGPEAPETTITKGPAAGGFRLQTRARIRFESSDVGSSYQCTLDGEEVSCDGTDGALLEGLAPGTHRFTVAAVDSEGNVDATPAVRRWATPYPVGQLQRAGGWTRYSNDDAYRGAFLRTQRSGATLTRRASGVQRVGLVIGKSPNAGRVAVLVGGQRVAVRNLQDDRTRGTVLLTLPRLASARSGAVTVRTLDGGKPVRVEGLGILQR
ncbi:M12 family metallo-peptidase [uncultured Nocardioides sp.]|uniref:M12 family metallo-peptidase n=1 Tax=uncultured Nocardioides sp. TaxID=198441 RepID=UPI00261ED4ED|nr:M12 family metallo-peptidase [uncultured Nocardioides sp.]